MTPYTIGAIIYVLLVALLVGSLFVLTYLVLNLGLMSKRPEDRIGGRSPSDVGILQHNVWPETPYLQNTLPAEENEEDIPPTRRAS